MKKIVSLLLVTLFVFSAFCFSGCGAINKSEVAVLWAGECEATNPNSLINSMERAMYIENVKYAHYGADGNASEQLEQAKTAINGGCAVLAIELVDSLAAQQIVDLAKAKNVPVIFFNCEVSETVLESYDKCLLVASDDSTLPAVQGTLIAEYVNKNSKKLDKNSDGKISYIDGTLVYGASTVEKANELLTTKLELSDSDDPTAAELIIVDNALSEAAVLAALQEKDYNTDKLTTHFVPIFTVGDSVDYKALVLAGRPELPENLIIGENDSDKEIQNKDKEIKKLTELQEYYEECKYVVDLTAVNESDLEEMIYTTRNVIDSGRIVGTALEDIDAISLAVAAITRNFIKGNDTFKGVVPKTKEGEPATIVVEGSVVLVRYTTYSN